MLQQRLAQVAPEPGKRGTSSVSVIDRTSTKIRSVADGVSAMSRDTR
jgi:hypothetical protein